MHLDSSTGARDAVLLDPHPLWLDALEEVLARVGATVVAKTTSAQDALDAIERHRPQLLTLELDTQIGEPTGLEVLRRAKTLVPSLRAIVLSAHHDAGHVDAALAAGAAAYVLKTAHPDDVVAAVRQTFDHSIYLAGTSGSPGTGPPAPERPGGLTRRELEILRLVAEGHSNAQLARMLWVTEQTVKFHLSNVYRKLEVANRTEASRWAQLNGVLTQDPESAESADLGA